MMYIFRCCIEFWIVHTWTDCCYCCSFSQLYLSSINFLVCFKCFNVITVWIVCFQFDVSNISAPLPKSPNDNQFLFILLLMFKISHSHSTQHTHYYYYTTKKKMQIQTIYAQINTTTTSNQYKCTFIWIP